MNTTRFNEARAAQAHIIGTSTIMAAYLPTNDLEADRAYIIAGVDELAIMTRKLSAACPDATVPQKAMLALGATFCAKALGWGLKGMHRLATLLDLDGDEEVLAAVKRVLLARKVLVRRELERAVVSVEDVAKDEGISVAALLANDDGLYAMLCESVHSSLEASKKFGLSKDFIGRMKSRLGIE
tara:strand:- start:4499 stop:5050 length:552 start_codon:yes stop_codon:yes gene_type:complete